MKTFVLNGLKRKILPNPTIEVAKEILEEVRGYDKITSIGGGSTIDIGKYVAFNLKIPHTAIPTTAGTGSEVTKYAVFVQDGKKISLEDDGLIPDNYVLNPELVLTLPPDQTASTGLDALSQAIESYWSPLSTSKSRWYSYQTIRIVMSTLLYSFHHPKNELFRHMMLEAANYSGRAINLTRTSICHAISYPLTIHYGIPHGQACIATLPFFIDYFHFKIVADWEVDALIESLGMRIKQKIDIELVAKEALESNRANNTPKPINKEIILESLKW